MDEINIRELLEKNGWTEQREVDINDTVSFLTAEGYVVGENQMDFLKQFEGLEIEFNNPRLPSTKEKLIIDPIKASSTIFRSLVAEYEGYCGKIFVIVGEIEEENMTVYMDNIGFFYGAYDDCLIMLGESFEKCLFNLVNGTKLEIMYVD